MVVAQLGDGRLQHVAVHELSIVEAISGCNLVLCRKSWDQGMLQVGNAAFECGFTESTWDNVAGMIEPFEEGSRGYQWLASGDARLLLSNSGQW